jgi:hypothetical protein
LTVEAREVAQFEISPAAMREQLELLVQDPVFRSSKRSVQFLRFVVGQTLEGSADQIKERTIGVEVFGRNPSYDTSLDRVVRTAAIELRKRLAVYYGDERHRSELHISLVPGSHIPRFTYPAQLGFGVVEPEVSHPPPGLPFVVTQAAEDHGLAVPTPSRKRRNLYAIGAVAIAVLLASAAYSWLHRPTAQDLFWKPVLETPGFVLLAAGDVPDGPPTPSMAVGEQGMPLPIVH